MCQVINREEKTKLILLWNYSNDCDMKIYMEGINKLRFNLLCCNRDLCRLPCQQFPLAVLFLPDKQYNDINFSWYIVIVKICHKPVPHNGNITCNFYGLI